MNQNWSKVTPEVLRIVNKYTQTLKERAIPVEKVILFGSQARGTATEESDIDVLVVVKKIDKEIRAIIIDEAFNLSLQENVDLIAIPYDIEEYYSPLFKIGSFYKNVYNDGVVII